MTQTLTAALARAPDAAPALSDVTGSVSHGELHDLAQRAATVLQRAYGRGHYLPVHAQPTVDFVVTLLAAIYSGNTPVPVDAKLPEAALAPILETCRFPTVLAPLDRRVLVTPARLDAADPAVPALVVFTSGTTSRPKGVLMSHANLLHACSTIAGYLHLDTARSTALVLPLHYSYGLIGQLLCELWVGGHVRLFGDLGNPFALHEAVESEGIRYFCGVPATFQALVKIHRLKPIAMPSVRVVCSAGAAFDHALYGAVKQVFPNATVFNNYGMTEACPRIAQIADSDPAFFRRACGRPIAGLTVKAVDPQTFEEVPAGHSGVLVIRGPNVTSGYLHDPERTRRAFTPDGFLVSGDLGHIEDGIIFVEGRIDDIFNVGGEKVSPAEIEEALRSIEQVEAAAVRGFHDPLRGAVPYAFVVLREEIDKPLLDAVLRSKLTPNKMPARYFVVSSLPVTSNGKVRRQALAPESALVIREITHRGIP